MTWIVILGVGIGSFVFRVGPLLVLERRPLGDSGDRIIRHAGTAAIAALIATSTKHSATGSLVVPTLLGVAVATVLAARRASMIRLLVCGGSIYAGSAIIIALLSR